ncbi:anhydro-N-acetylmuramic acid kinase [Thioalkalivibrio denitrificans]|uniref:Anhydro-N-acetylmuramic acid kinase n=1 Tax=Thioalkalivibrio denitrificans TaxID=108003 RepID=A0A1V3NUY6_9GAMM|nr:anhydro-N-acetylmuramic acid kinase [Thioalkalivibrio denitrificans]OOG28784.1 anhydro-N-acetylmuramic acid kinase [Thioalkalivibrio denitrificans]
MNPDAPFVGLISGTSMDAVDAVVVRFGDGIAPALLARHSHPIPDALAARLRRLADPKAPTTLDELGQADVLTGELFAQAALQVITGANLEPAAIAAIGSHGQTVRHRPDSDPPFTLQIGNAGHIAYGTGITTVADFRQQDMAAGGQGAPLVPAFHRAVFGSPDESRVVVNIGGIANITHLPPGGPVGGFDTGPGNTLMDLWVRRHRDLPYDDDGAWARTGRLLDDLLDRLMADPYLHAPPPKSTGPEYFGAEWLERHLGGSRPEAHDVQRTLLEFTARSVAGAIAAYANDSRRTLVCGGGAHNGLLMERLAALMPARTVTDTAAAGIDPDWVEAMAFAWLAREALLGRPGNVREVTGAREDVILGGIFPGSGKWQVASGKE